MKCIDCAYCWQERGEKYPRCHYCGPDGWAPCECEEPEEVADDD